MNPTRIRLLTLLLVLPVTPAAGSVFENGDTPALEQAEPARLDPFRCLIQEPPPPPVEVRPDITATPPPIVHPALQLDVAAYGSEGDHSLAVLTYKGVQYLVEEGWESDDNAFQVKSIRSGENGAVTVEVYDKTAQRLQTVTFGADKDKVASSVQAPESAGN